MLFRKRFRDLGSVLQPHLFGEIFPDGRVAQISNAVLIHLSIPENDDFAAGRVRADGGKFAVLGLFARLFPHEKLLLLTPVFGKAKQYATTSERKQKGVKRENICETRLVGIVQIIPTERKSGNQNNANQVQQTIQGETRFEHHFFPRAFHGMEQLAEQVRED